MTETETRCELMGLKTDEEAEVALLAVEVFVQLIFRANDLGQNAPIRPPHRKYMMIGSSRQ